jgi:hypothetical protein
MFCPSCNTRNQFYHNYCYYCGHKLKEDDKSMLMVKGDQVDIPNDALETVETAETEAVEAAEMELQTVEAAESEVETTEVVEAEFDTAEMSDIVEDELNEDETDIDSSINTSRSHSYDDIFLEHDLFGDDNSFTSSMTDIDLSTQMPLRRSQKDKRSSRSGKPLKTILSILSLAFIFLIIFYFMSQTGRRYSKPDNNLPQTIAVSASVEEMVKDDERAYRIVFNTANGKEVSLFDEIKPVENGRAEFIVEEDDLYAYNPQLNEEGMYEVHLDAIITAPNLPETIESLSITLSEPYNYAPFTLLQPSSSGTEFQEDSTKVSFRVESGSTVIVNGEDLTEMVTEDGRFEMEVHLPPQKDDLVLDIRVTTPGYLDNIQQLILRKAQPEVVFSINETSPIPSDEQWVKISGLINPEAVLEADTDIFEEPEIDSSTGNFTAYIKADRPGYNACTLTAKHGDKESSIEIIVDRKTTVESYTSTAWQPVYTELQQDEQLHNGRHFVFNGNIEDIIETGQKSVFTVSQQSQSDQIYYVEFWGDFDFNPGDRIRVFGNRWGNKDGHPRFLAKYVYH